MVRATFIKCSQHTKFMNYLSESHNDPMELILFHYYYSLFTEGKRKTQRVH